MVNSYLVPLHFEKLLVQMAEYRISIYGRKQSEWDQLASWIVNNNLYSQNVVWLIQVQLTSSFVDGFHSLLFTG
jgi:adenosine deaminase